MAANLEILIKARDEASGILGGVEKSAGGLSSALGTGLKVAAAGAGIGIAGLGAFLVKSIGEAAEAQKVTAQLEAVLKSTGGVAGVTKDEILEMADALAETTTFSDDAIVSMQNVLLTFTKIKGPTVRGATQAVLDMSTALGQDLQSSAIMVGKALNDPIAGVTALRKVGVTLTDQQEAMIKTMVEAGDVMGAQKIILGELSTEFGGSAAAAADTFDGKMTMLKKAFSEVQEVIGTALLPIVTDLATALGKFLTDHKDDIGLFAQSFVDWSRSEAWPVLKTVLGDLATAVGDIKDEAVELKPVLEDLAEAFGALPEPVRNVTFALAGVTAALGLLVAAGLPVIGITKLLAGTLAILGGYLITVALMFINVLGPISLLIGILAALGVSLDDVRRFLMPFAVALAVFLEWPIHSARRAVDWLIRQLEVLIDLIGKIKIPDLNPFGGMPDINPFQHGGLVPSRGLQLVGEAGPEIVKLPGGSRVFSNRESQNMAGRAGSGSGASIAINVNNRSLSGLSRREAMAVARDIRSELERMMRRG